MSRRHWKAEIPKFAQTLDSCDEVSTWTVDANTSAAASFGDPTSFPLRDPNASGGEIVGIDQKIEQLRQAVAARLTDLLVQTGAATSDIVGIFDKLQPREKMRNVLVIFSDGKESAAGISLEDGAACVSPANVDLPVPPLSAC